MKAPFGWAFQKDSELVEMFNHHTQKMKERGTLSWLRQDIVQNFDKEKDASKVNDAHVLAFEKVAFPFLALLTGILLSFVQIASEFLTSYRKQLCNSEQI